MADADRETDYLKRRIAELESQLAGARDQIAELAKHNDRYAGLVNQASQDLEAINSSARWKVGDRLCRLLERLLLRPRPSLVMDRLREALASSRNWQNEDWKLKRAATRMPVTGPAHGQPLKTMLPPAELDGSAFQRWLSVAPIRPADAERMQSTIVRETAEADALLEQTRWIGTLPLVSIIMPTYNRADIIGDSIQSVLDQRYSNWELLVCDDGSDDGTERVIQSKSDARIHWLELPHQGAAAARNAGLKRAAGDIIAYLDSDNLWHPNYLAAMVASLIGDRSRYCAYAAYFDLQLGKGDVRLRNAAATHFAYDRLAKKNFVDLNSFVHWRSLYDALGGFTESLPRQQDWDLVLKYTFLRNPALVDLRLTLYRRNADWQQLTELQKTTGEQTRSIIRSNLNRYYEHGLPVKPLAARPRVTVLIWDVCRNHFSKAFNVAEALSQDYDVQLLGFRFFDEPLFPPYEGVEPPFECVFFDGAPFPEFFETMTRALNTIRGDFIYCVKPRLPSLGLALLAHYHHGTPFAVECNDLESVVSSPDRELLNEEQPLNLADPELATPYGRAWTQHLEVLTRELPLKVTHNENLNQWLAGGCHFLRNIKDESAFDPSKINRAEQRKRLGFAKNEFVLLFSGLVRRHKGIFDLATLVENGPDHLRLVVIGSRETPDLKRLKASAKVTLLPPQGRNEVAKTTAAADGIVLWLDPNTSASHYQMPFKLTDALALNLRVFANRISDLTELIEEGYVEHVPFGDVPALTAAIANPPPEAPDRRALFLRQFSYRSARASMALLLDRARSFPDTLQTSAQWAETMSEYFRTCRDETAD